MFFRSGEGGLWRNCYLEVCPFSVMNDTEVTFLFYKVSCYSVNVLLVSVGFSSTSCRVYFDLKKHFLRLSMGRFEKDAKILQEIQK